MKIRGFRNIVAHRVKGNPLFDVYAIGACPEDEASTPHCIRRVISAVRVSPTTFKETSMTLYVNGDIENTIGGAAYVNWDVIRCKM